MGSTRLDHIHTLVISRHSSLLRQSRKPFEDTRPALWAAAVTQMEQERGLPGNWQFRQDCDRLGPLFWRSQATVLVPFRHAQASSVPRCSSSYLSFTAPILDVDWRNNISFATCSTDQVIYLCKLGDSQPVRSFLGHTVRTHVFSPFILYFRQYRNIFLPERSKCY